LVEATELKRKAVDAALKRLSAAASKQKGARLRYRRLALGWEVERVKVNGKRGK
jgi:hypothetical protein